MRVYFKSINNLSLVKTMNKHSLIKSINNLTHMCKCVLRRPIVFLRVRYSIFVRCSILISLIKLFVVEFVRCSIPHCIVDLFYSLFSWRDWWNDVQIMKKHWISSQIAAPTAYFVSRCVIFCLAKTGNLSSFSIRHVCWYSSGKGHCQKIAFLHVFTTPYTTCVCHLLAKDIVQK